MKLSRNSLPVAFEYASTAGNISTHCHHFTAFRMLCYRLTLLSLSSSSCIRCPLKSVTLVRAYHSKGLLFPFASSRSSFDKIATYQKNDENVCSPSRCQAIPTGYSYDSLSGEGAIRNCVDLKGFKKGTESPMGCERKNKATLAVQVHDSKELDDIIVEVAELLIREASENSQKITNRSKKKNTLNFHALDSSESYWRYSFVMFLLLLGYFIAVVYLIFFLFDWNLMEPTTFFTGQFVVLWAMWHHMRYLGTIPFSWPGVFATVVARSTSKKVRR